MTNETAHLQWQTYEYNRSTADKKKPRNGAENYFEGRTF